MSSRVVYNISLQFLDSPGSRLGACKRRGLVWERSHEPPVCGLAIRRVSGAAPACQYHVFFNPTRCCARWMEALKPFPSVNCSLPIRLLAKALRRCACNTPVVLESLSAASCGSRLLLFGYTLTCVTLNARVIRYCPYSILPSSRRWSFSKSGVSFSSATVRSSF